MPARSAVLLGAVAIALGAALAACGEMATLPFSAGVGPDPQIPAPNKTLIPTVDIAPAKGWPDGAGPKAATGTAVAAFAKDLKHPRWLYVLPNGDVLVAESSKPTPPPGADKGKDGGPTAGIKAWFMKKAMKKAGSAVPSANQITLLRDADGDGAPEIRSVFLQNLNSPF